MRNETWFDITLQLTEELLGTVPKNREVYSRFIATQLHEHAAKNLPLAGGDPSNSQAVQTAAAEEVETTPEEIENRGYTGFHEDENGPFLFDYAIKGFLHEAANTLKEMDDIKQLKDKFKRYSFVRPRRIRLPRPGRIEDFGGKPMLVVTDKGIVCERPLRAQTAQGPRVTVVRSDVILAGQEISFKLVLLKSGGLTQQILREVLSYGEYQGLGQWRGGGWGRFDVTKFERC